MDKPITVISGHCRGVDIMAKKYAAERDYQIMLFPAQWQKYGSAAGPIRNKKMAEICDCVIAFWDYSSKGTGSLIRYAEKLGKKTIVIDISH